MATGSDQAYDFRFAYYGGGEGRRHQPMRVDWRELPHAQIEIPEGGSWLLELADRPPLVVGPGEAVVLPRGTRHAMAVRGPRPMLTTWSMFCIEDAAGRDVLAAAAVPPAVPRRTGVRLLALARELRALDPAVSRGEFRALARRQALGFRMMELLLAHAGSPVAARPDPEIERLRPVLQYIEANLARPLYVRDLARQAYLSVSRFHCVFSRAMGCGPLAYVLAARLRRAQHLLLSTDLPVGEIGEGVGFASSHYFNRAFRQRLRTTPGLFRQSFNAYRPAKSPTQPTIRGV